MVIDLSEVSLPVLDTWFDVLRPEAWQRCPVSANITADENPP
jgi:hypothetical protein